MGLRKAVSRAVSWVLDRDDTTLPSQQYACITDFLSHQRYDLSSTDLAELLATLKNKHLVESILVTSKTGQLFAASEPDGVKEAVLTSALYNYVNAELARAHNVTIQTGDQWLMIYPFNQKLFVVKSASGLSNLELRALARELETTLIKRAVVVPNGGKLE